MLKRLIFAFVVFTMLLTIPNISLNLFEKKLGLTSEASGKENTLKNADAKPEEKVARDTYEPELIKVFNTKTNEVMVIDFEEYLKGVVASEMPVEFDIEALKAQAVAARTYLLYRLKKYPDGQAEHPKAAVCTGVHCQAWNSKDDLIASHYQGWYDENWDKIESAVESTRGQILTYEGKIIEPLYHSTSGGRTENSEDVFSLAVPYLRSVESPYEGDSPKLNGSVKISTSEFIEKIESVYGDMDIREDNLEEKILLGEVSEGGRIKTIIIDDKEISGREIRSLFNLNSTNFSFIQNGNEIEILTTGYGHGVGMSQWGADGMAKEGYNYQEILKHYYTGVEIVNMK
ncbi:MAG TPA: stage II sporulation protein D [Sedimentibacter sp.]|nr:stage II sporulation protein D [Sedimentibacter sp.]HRC81781.1 stage II sporulation protein D [Sedimentibacter sp.]